MADAAALEGRLLKLESAVHHPEKGLVATATLAESTHQICMDCRKTRRQTLALIATISVALLIQIFMFVYQWGTANATLENLTQEVQLLRGKMDNVYPGATRTTTTTTSAAVPSSSTPAP
jgi:hypothetical protein